MIPFHGRVWRIIPQGSVPLAAARNAEGRFHHSGQWAIYTSLTPEGTVVAIRRYLRADDGPRVIAAIDVRAEQVRDLRGRPEVSAVWQDRRATGQTSPTWAWSDAARDDGAQGMLYSSRSRPDLTHLVLFDPDCAAISAGAELLSAAPYLSR